MIKIISYILTIFIFVSTLTYGSENPKNMISDSTDSFDTNNSKTFSYYCNTKKELYACTLFALWMHNHNELKAIMLLDQNCNKGESQACLLMYGRYKMRKDSNSEKANSFLSKACSILNIEDCKNTIEKELESPDKINKRSMMIMKSHCEKNEREACYHVGLNEYILNKNFSEARKYFNRLCSKDDTSSCVMLLSIDEKTGVKSDLWSTNKKLCEIGNIPACAHVATYEFEAGNITEARKLFQKSCNGKIINSCTALGILEKSQNNLELARKIFQQACDKHEQIACNNLIELEKR